MSNETAIFWHFMCYFTDKVSNKVRKRKGKGRKKKDGKSNNDQPISMSKGKKGKLDWPGHCFKTLN